MTTGRRKERTKTLIERPVVNEYFIMALVKIVIPEGYCNSSINVWERFIDPNETLLR